ncbi:MAG: hypothetical protein GX879_04830 [Bacteroidales bacterium]|nr:hypothetical protein [Bacteroidales bacterium]
MKKTSLIFALLFAFSFAFSQENQLITTHNNSQDTIFKTQHMLGINVFPAFGILGGGSMNNSKLTFQYKLATKSINYRVSLNYINYYSNKNRFDIVGITPDTIIPAKPGGDTIFNSLKVRSYDNHINTYDLRFGAEYALDKKDYRFYIGLGGIVGMHNVANSYEYFNIPYNGYPVENVNLSYYFYNQNETLKVRTTNFLKLGIDLSLGVDFKLNDNWVIAIQYTPEFAHYKWIKSDTSKDIDNIYTKELESFNVFSPDFIDLIIYIKF